MQLYYMMPSQFGIMGLQGKILGLWDYTLFENNGRSLRFVERLQFVMKWKPLDSGPERWHALPRRAPFVSILYQNLSKDVKEWRHDVTSHDVRWHLM